VQKEIPATPASAAMSSAAMSSAASLSEPSDTTPTASLSARYRALDAAHHVHPSSDMGTLNREGSRVIVSAKGVRIHDAEGHTLIDGMAGLWCVNVGYGRQELVDAATAQMHMLPYYNTFFKTTHPPVIALSALLASLTPPQFNRFFYCSGGSEAIDTMLRIVYRYWQTQDQPEKKFIIARKNGYHGSTIAGASLGGMAPMHAQIPSRVAHIEHIDQPDWFMEGGDATPDAFGLARAAQLEARILTIGADRVAAFVAEPFQGAGGVIFPPATYWGEIQRICRKYDVLLVADEVIGGFGRTGEWFSHQHFGFEPDVMTLAKGLTSGYIPMGAVALHDRIAGSLETGGEFTHGLTYSGHPVAAAVAVANLTLLRDEGIVDTVKHDTGPYFQQQLREVLADHRIVGDIAGVGMVASIALVEDPATRRQFAHPGAVGSLCRDASLRHGLMMRATGDRMILSPPLVMGRDDIDQMVSMVKKAVDEAAG